MHILINTLKGDKDPSDAENPPRLLYAHNLNIKYHRQ